MALQPALLGLASLGWAPGWSYWDWYLQDAAGTGLARTGLTGTVAPGQPWDGLTTRALGLILLG